MKNNLTNKINAVLMIKELTVKEKKEWIAWLKKSDKQTNELKQEFGVFYETVNKIVFDFNPINVPRDKENKDKYKFESEDILKKIKIASSQQELNKIVVRIFIKSFYKEIVHRRLELYKQMSEKIWKEWLRFSHR